MTGENEAAGGWPQVCTWVREIVDDGDREGIARDLVRHREGGNDDLVLLLQLEGRCRVRQAGVALVIDATDILLLDAGSPSRLTLFGASRQLCLSLPRPPTTNAALRAQPIAVIRGEIGIGRALPALLLAVQRLSGILSASDQRALRTAILGLVLAALEAQRAQAMDNVGGAAPPQLVAALQATIEARLADPGLCPAQVAAIHGISTRQLHRRFKEAGTSFTAFVRQRRLAHCRDDLADPRRRRLPMTEIAFRWGFSDSAHFSRCFRAAFGCTARDFRAGRQTAAGVTSAAR